MSDQYRHEIAMVCNEGDLALREMEIRYGIRMNYMFMRGIAFLILFHVARWYGFETAIKVFRFGLGVPEVKNANSD